MMTSCCASVRARRRSLSGGLLPGAAGALGTVPAGAARRRGPERRRRQPSRLGPPATARAPRRDRTPFVDLPVQLLFVCAPGRKRVAAPLAAARPR